MLIIIPFLSVLLCLIFKLAQGEKVEEIEKTGDGSLS